MKGKGREEKGSRSTFTKVSRLQALFYSHTELKIQGDQGALQKNREDRQTDKQTSHIFLDS